MTGSDVIVLFLEFRFPGSGLGEGICHSGHAQTCPDKRCPRNRSSPRNCKMSVNRPYYTTVVADDIFLK